MAEIDKIFKLLSDSEKEVVRGVSDNIMVEESKKLQSLVSAMRGNDWWTLFQKTNPKYYGIEHKAVAKLSLGHLPVTASLRDDGNVTVEIGNEPNSVLSHIDNAFLEALRCFIVSAKITDSRKTAGVHLKTRPAHHDLLTEVVGNKVPGRSSPYMTSRPIGMARVVDAASLYFGLVHDKEVKSARFHGGFLEFQVERYTDHGYETYTGNLPLHEKSGSIQIGMPQSISSWYVITGELEAELTDSPTESLFTEDDARKFLSDNEVDIEGENDPKAIMSLAFDYGMGEGIYCAPDDDFVYGEIYEAMEEGMLHMSIEFQKGIEGRPGSWITSTKDQGFDENEIADIGASLPRT